MTITGSVGWRCFTAESSARPEVPGMRMSDTSTWGAPLSSAASASEACAKVLNGIPSRVSAFSNTQRIDRSSSTTQTGFITVLLQRQHNAEAGAPGLAFDFDHTVMVLNEGLPP